MTVKEAIGQLKCDRELIQFDPSTGEVYEENRLQYCVSEMNYKTWLADGMAIEALQKQEPQKPLTGGMCKCGCVLADYFIYCPKCGQQLDRTKQEEIE